MNSRFIITITDYHWSCGDGCCSDSGYKIYVRDNMPEKEGYNCVMENTDWESNPPSNELLKSAIECIAEKIGRTPIEDEDYCVIKDVAWSDDEDKED